MCCVCTEPTVRYVTEMRKGQCRHNHTHIMEQHNLYTVELVAPRQPPACRVAIIQVCRRSAFARRCCCPPVPVGKTVAVLQVKLLQPIPVMFST